MALYPELFPGQAPTPQAATFEETLNYFFNENEVRAAQSVAGLEDADLNADPGQEAWSIGELLQHQLHLIRMMCENMEPDSTSNLGKLEIGEKGNWSLSAITDTRSVYAQRFHEVFERMTPEKFMATRPGVHPKFWAEWPALMRVLRPLLDISTHIGQVNYARRQLGKPVGK